jgi:DNA mismatch repair protein MutS2
MNAEPPPRLAAGDDLRLRSESLLEFPKVQEMLAGRTHFFLARELAVEARPSYDADEVERLQSETAEAGLLIDSRGDIGLTGLRDPRPAITRAALGGLLTGEELVGAAVVLDAAWQAAQAVSQLDDKAPLLGAIAGRVVDFRQFKKAVDHALSERGDVLDRATPALGPMRRRIAATYNRLARALERMIADAPVRQALQSGAIATRGDRLVLEVRIEERKAVPGIVHDVSKTGATLFVEPFGAVDLCNEWREASAEAAREEERVLWALSEQLATRADDARASVQAVAELDLVVARARLARAMRAERPGALPADAGTVVKLVAARHPLIGASAVPLTAWLGPGFTSLVITGPNTGGKTVALKTIGLFALMYQAGLQLPAASGTAFRVFDGIYADIGDAQSIERSVSTFSSHMGNVVAILGRAGPGSLVLIDELGTGTDPEEGSSLARAILDELGRRRIPAVVTTHHRSVAEHASRRPGMENASVELDPDTMTPTYHLVMGIPGRSYAITVARRLGLPPEIVEAAQSGLSAPHVKSEELLRQLQAERKKVAEASAAAEADRADAARMKRELLSSLSEVNRRRENLVEKTRRELQREIADVRSRLAEIEDRARAAGQAEQARAELERMRQQVRERGWGAAPAGPEVAVPASEPGTPDGHAETADAGSDEDRPLAPGDTVEVKGLEVQAKVEGLTADGRVNLLMGSVHVTLDQNEVRRIAAAEAAGGPERYSLRLTQASVDAGSPPDSIGLLDLRGARVHEVAERVAAFLDRCMLNGLRTARIVHGRGTGAVREAVREALARHPSAAGFASADQSSGGDGVTVVELA